MQSQIVLTGLVLFVAMQSGFLEILIRGIRTLLMDHNPVIHPYQVQFNLVRDRVKVLQQLIESRWCLVHGLAGMIKEEGKGDDLSEDVLSGCTHIVPTSV